MAEAVVSNKIKEVRQSAGLTIRMLAEKADVSVGTIHRLEESETCPTLSVAYYLAEALKCEVSDLFTVRKVRRYAGRDGEFQLSQAS